MYAAHVSTPAAWGPAATPLPVQILYEPDQDDEQPKRPPRARKPKKHLFRPLSAKHPLTCAVPGCDLDRKQHKGFWDE